MYVGERIDGTENAHNNYRSRRQSVPGRRHMKSPDAIVIVNRVDRPRFVRDNPNPTVERAGPCSARRVFSAKQGKWGSHLPEVSIIGNTACQ
jgi:hypothetical protein